MGEQAQLFDAGNPLIEAVPSMLTTGTVPAPGGGRPVQMVVTIRTPSTTLTVLLDREFGMTWSRNIAETACLLAAPQAPSGNGRAHHHHG